MFVNTFRFSDLVAQNICEKETSFLFTNEYFIYLIFPEYDITEVSYLRKQYLSTISPMS
jgi:hypothetical protein